MRQQGTNLMRNQRGKCHHNFSNMWQTDQTNPALRVRNETEQSEKVMQSEDVLKWRNVAGTGAALSYTTQCSL